MSIITPGGLPVTDRKGNPIYTDFRNMIRLESLFDDSELGDSEKIYYALQLFYGEDIPEPESAIGELMWFYNRGEEQGKSSSGRSKPPIYDFEEDADYIYAAFLSAYNIDLSGDKPLHWWLFMALMCALPENTQMAQRMYYRGVDTSKMKGAVKKDYEARKKAVALKKKRGTLKGMTAEELEAATLERVNRRFEEAKKMRSGQK